MKNQTKTKPQSRIERAEKVWTPDSKLYIPHEDKEITFAYPSFGPDTYQSVGKQILEHNLEISTAEQTASLLYSAYFSDEKNEPEFENIRKIMRNRWFVVFNRNLSTDKGIYVVQDNEARRLSEQLSVNDLEKRLKNGKEIKGIEVRISEDGIVRFAPKGSYILGEQTSEQLSKDGFAIASYGKKGAENLAEISEQFRYQPRVWGLDVKDKKPELRLSALDEFNDWLLVDGDYFDDYGNGHAFGVLK